MTCCGKAHRDEQTGHDFCSLPRGEMLEPDDKVGRMKTSGHTLTRLGKILCKRIDLARLCQQS